MPVAVFILGVAAGLEVMSCRMLLIMSLISFGVLVASYGEININWIGVVYQMGGVVGEALRLIFMEILVKRKGIKLNPISVMYYVSPCRHVLSSTIEALILSTIFNYYMIDKSCLVNVIIVLLQCSLLVHSVDFPGETKDGCPGDMELSSSHPNTQLPMYFCPQSISFPCDFTYKCFNNSRCWSCKGLGGCLTISTSLCRYKADDYKSVWLWHW